MPSTEQAAANLQDSLGFDGMSAEQVASTSFDPDFKLQTIEPYSEIKMNMKQPVYDPKTGQISGGTSSYDFVPTGEGTQVPSAFDKVKKYGATAYAGASYVKGELDKFGLLDETGQVSAGGLGVVDGGVAMYEAANNSWTSQGFGGEAPYGIGNSNYFSSIYSPETLLPFGRLA